MSRSRLLVACLVSISASCASAAVGSGEPDSGDPGPQPQPDARPPAEGESDASISVSACESVPSGWSRVGEAIAPIGGFFTGGDIAIDAEGRPVVIFSSGSPAAAYVYRFEGASWVQLGPALEVNPDTTSVYDPSIRAVGEDLVAMFLESGGATGIGVYVGRFVAGAAPWQMMGGGDLSTTSANVVGSDMHVDGSDLLVAWSQYSDGVIGQSRVHLRRFTGDAYVPLNPFMGGIAGPGASAITPSITVNAAGNEVVFFSESGVRHLERTAGGSDWQYHGEVSPASSLNGGFSPKGVADAQGRVLMAMAEYSGDPEGNLAYVQRWTGSSWAAIGNYHAVTAEGTHATPADLIVDAFDEPIVAILEAAIAGQARSLFVGHHVGNGDFETLGGGALSGGDNTQGVISAKLASDECGFHVVFVEAPDAESERAVHVFRWKD